MKMTKKQYGGVKKGVLALACFALTCAAHAEGELTALQTQITSTAAAVATATGACVVAGFAIFGIVWGAKKLKAAISSGA